MDTFYWLLSGCVTIIIAVMIGYSITQRRVFIGMEHILAGCGSILFVALIGTMLGRTWTFTGIDRALEFMSGILLLGLCGMLVATLPVYPGVRERYIFLAVIVMELFLLSIRYGRINDHGYIFPLIACACVIMGIIGGLQAVQIRIPHWRWRKLFPYAPVFVMLLIGIWRIFP